MMPKIRISESSDAEKCTQERQKSNFDAKNLRDLSQVESAFAPLPPKNEEAAQV